MKVKEAIAALQNFDPEAEIVAYGSCSVFEVDSFSKCRNEDGIVGLYVYDDQPFELSTKTDPEDLDFRSDEQFAEDEDDEE